MTCLYKGMTVSILARRTHLLLSEFSTVTEEHTNTRLLRNHTDLGLLRWRLPSGQVLGTGAGALWHDPRQRLWGTSLAAVVWWHSAAEWGPCVGSPTKRCVWNDGTRQKQKLYLAWWSVTSEAAIWHIQGYDCVHIGPAYSPVVDWWKHPSDSEIEQMTLFTLRLSGEAARAGVCVGLVHLLEMANVWLVTHAICRRRQWRVSSLTVSFCLYNIYKICE